MSPRDLRPNRVRGVGRGEGGAVVLSIDVDGVHGEAGPPLKVVMTADEARLTAQLIREAAGRRGSVAAEMAAIRLVGSASEADGDVFPLDTPVAMSSADLAMIAALGDEGTLPHFVAAVRARHADRPCRIVVVRVDEDEPPAIVAEGWGRSIGRRLFGRHVRGFLGFRSSSGADPRAPP